MKTTRLLVLLIASLFCLCKTALAQEDNREAYAVLKSNTLTFYYDNERSTRNGSKFNIPWIKNNPEAKPGWYLYRDGITTVVFDDSFSNYDGLSSTANMFYELTDLTTIEGIENLKTENVTDMSYMFYNCYNLGSLDLYSFNTSNVTNMSNMFSGCNNLNSLNVSSFNTSNVTDMSNMFSSCYNLNSLDVSSFNTEMVENMSDMFSYCSSLSSLNLSSFNTSNVNDMSNMFDRCSTLASLTLSPLFKTPNVENMTNMFANCFALGSLNLSSFETTNVKYMDGMFNYCSSLTELDLSSFYTNAIISMTGMFSSCAELQSVDIRNFSITISDPNLSYSTASMFWGCSNLTEIICLNSFVDSNIDSGSMFSFCTNLKGSNGTVFDSDKEDGTYAHPDGGPSNPGYFTDGKPYAILSDGTLTFYYDLNKGSTGFDFPTDNNAPDWTALEVANTITTVTFDESFHKYTGLTSPKLLFNGLSNLETINNLKNLPTANVTDMSYMFSGFSNLTSIDLTNFNTARVTDMSNMFSGCSGLTSLNLSGLNTENVTDMSHMFEDCSSLTSLDLSGLDTKNVTNMSHMFEGCSSLTGLDLSELNTENVIDVSYMFKGCSSLESQNLVLPDLNYYNYFSDDHLNNLSHMFEDCSSLTSIDVSKISTYYVTDMSYMFSGCSSLTSLDLYDFQTSSVEDMSFMFNGCTSLEFIYCYNDWADGAVSNSENMFAGCSNLPEFNSNEVTVAKANPTNGYFSVKREAYAYIDGNSLIFCYDTHKFEKFESYYEESVFPVKEKPETDENNEWDYEWARWIPYSEGVTKVIFEPSFVDFSPKSTMGWFSNMSLVNSFVGLENLNTEAVTDMSGMFFGCDNLTSLDLTSFKVSNVTLMQSMFEGCSNLEMIYAGDWSGVVCESENMFAGCENLPNWNEDNSNDINLAKPSENGGYFSTRSAYAVVENANLTFYYDGYNFEGTCSIDQNAGGTWKNATFSTVTFDPSFADYKLTSTAEMFSGKTGLTTIYDLDNLNTSSITDMSNMFNGCSGLTTIYCGKDWSGLDIPSTGMFAGCTNLVGAIAYDNNKTDIKYANPYDGYFYQPQAYAVQEGSVLTFYYDNRIDVHSDAIIYENPWNEEDFEPGWAYNDEITQVVFDPSFKIYHGINSTANMFNYMRNLSSIVGLEYLNTEKVTTMRYMFYGCRSLTSLNLSNFNTGNVREMWSMFQGCSSLTTLDLTNFNMTKVYDVDYLFQNCTSLETIYCNDDWSNNSFNFSNYSDLFGNCNNLKGCDGTTYDDYENYDSYNSISFAHPDDKKHDDPGFFTPLSEGKIILYDSSSNTNIISNNDNETVTVDVYFCERTLYRDGDWNTLCLPFSLTAEQLAASPLAGYAELRTLSGAQYEEGTLTLNFTLTEGDDAVTSIAAGKPYLIKWDQQSTDIVNPTFTNVTIQNVSESQMKVATDYVDFVGNFNPFSIGEAGDNTKLYLGASNGLYYPNGASTFYGFRAYFQLKNDLTAGPGPSTGSSQVKAFRLNFGDEENGIFLMEDGRSKMEDAYFTLDGRRLLSQPITPGLYIQNGRKVLIK